MNENIEHKMTSSIVINSCVGNLLSSIAGIQIRGVHRDAEASGVIYVLNHSLFRPDVVKGCLVKEGNVGGKR